MVALLESVWNLLQNYMTLCRVCIHQMNRVNSRNGATPWWQHHKYRRGIIIIIMHLTLGMLLHYLGKMKIQIFCRSSADMEENKFFIASNFVIHPQILIFTCFKIASFPRYWLQIKFSTSRFFYLFTCDQIVASEIHHSRCHCRVQRRGQDFY